MLKELPKNIIVTMCGLTLIMIVGLVASYLVDAHIGKILKPSKFGDYKVAINLCMLVGTLLALGLHLILAKYVPPLIKQNERRKSYELFYAIGKIITNVAIIFLLINLFSIGILLGLVQLHIIKFPTIHDCFYYLGFSGFFALFYLVTKFLRAINYVIISAIFVYAQIVIFLILIFLISDLSVLNAFIVNVLSHMIITLGALLIIFFQFKTVNIKPLRIERKLYTEAFLFNVQQFLANWRISILIFTIAILPRAKHEVGILSSLLTLTSLSMISVYVLKTIFPNYVSQHMDKSTIVIRQMLNSMLVLSLGFILVMSIFIYSISDYLLSFYGEAYQSSKFLVFWAVFANIPMACDLGHNNYLAFHEKGKIYLTWLLVISFILLIISSACLTTYFGVLGALYAYTFIVGFNSLGIFIGARILLHQDAKLEFLHS